VFCWVNDGTSGWVRPKGGGGNQYWWKRLSKNSPWSDKRRAKGTGTLRTDQKKAIGTGGGDARKEPGMKPCRMRPRKKQQKAGRKAVLYMSDRQWGDNHRNKIDKRTAQATRRSVNLEDHYKERESSEGFHCH